MRFRAFNKCLLYRSLLFLDVFLLFLVSFMWYFNNFWEHFWYLTIVFCGGLIANLSIHSSSWLLEAMVCSHSSYLRVLFSGAVVVYSSEWFGVLSQYSNCLISLWIQLYEHIDILYWNHTGLWSKRSIRDLKLLLSWTHWSSSCGETRRWHAVWVLGVQPAQHSPALCAVKSPVLLWRVWLWALASIEELVRPAARARCTTQDGLPGIRSENKMPITKLGITFFPLFRVADSLLSPPSPKPCISVLICLHKQLQPWVLLLMSPEVLVDSQQ